MTGLQKVPASTPQDLLGITNIEVLYGSFHPRTLSQRCWGLNMGLSLGVPCSPFPYHLVVCPELSGAV